MTSSIPIVILGRRAEVAKGVIAAIVPEYEVVHTFLASDNAPVDLPVILRGESLPPRENLGTQNYSRPVTAIITGGGYNDEMFNELREACTGISHIPWLRPDLSGGPPVVTLGYSEKVAARVKETLKKLADEGKMG
ncbi:hypothetical protein B7463_g5869, partial [Scytalidium lignicola]